MSMVCTGCGAPLQMEREGEKGYIAGDAFMREHPLCQRCYRLKHYGQFSPAGISEDAYRAAVMRVLDKPALVLYAVDLFDFNGSLVRGLTGVLKQHEVIMAANKFDLFPSGVRADRVRHWLSREARRAELDVAQAVVLSAKSGEGVDELRSILAARAKGRPIVVIGMANVGKSSLLNRIMEQHGEHVGHSFMTSHFPGTTLGAVAVKLTGGMTVVDTPGLLGVHRLQDRVCAASLKDIIPEQRLRPRMYQLRQGQTLFLSGLARVDFVRGPGQPFVVYVANQLRVHRTKLVQAD
ncbi:MAG: GTPase, partial [Bacilli bacterium]